MPDNSYTIGTDEAGYGSNLGALVISATLWNTQQDDDSFKHVMDDSKKLYTSHGSLARLERGVLAALDASGCHVNSLVTLLKTVVDKYEDQPIWEHGYDINLPIDAKQNEFTEITQQLKQNIVTLKSRVVQPKTFNNILKTDCLKSTLLTRQTLSLVQKIIATLPANATIIVYSDKHGGRNNYIAPILEILPDASIRVIIESRDISSYKLQNGSRKIEWHFASRGESRYQIALASMLSKYIRELLMKSFNDFWQKKIPNLTPTAGYPLDAKRFIKEINPTREQLGIPLEDVWREK